MLRDEETFEKAAKTFEARGSNQLKNSAFQYRVCDERWKADVCQRLYVMVAQDIYVAQQYRCFFNILSGQG